jgi:hypothetical protein
MTKFGQWPAWVQMVVGVPHAVLLSFLAWVWSPQDAKSWYWFVGVLLYLGMFYFIFVR